MVPHCSCVSEARYLQAWKKKRFQELNNYKTSIHTRRGHKAHTKHVEALSSALVWSCFIRMTLHYTPGWIIEALAGEHFNWCMNMQLCLIPGPEINQVRHSGGYSEPHHLHSHILWLFARLGSISPSLQLWNPGVSLPPFYSLPPPQANLMTQQASVAPPNC